MFYLSLFFILISSYLFTVTLLKKEPKKNLGVIYFLLLAFSQIVLSFEVLSLFSLIGKMSFLICNAIVFIISIILWAVNKPNCETFERQFFNELKNISKTLKKDKLLFIVSICFLFFLIAELLSVLFINITFADALTYYFTRCTTWIQNGNISHFITPDTRELIMPVNTEFLYTWVLMFFKSERGLAIFSYISLLNLLFVLYNFLGETGFSRRRRLWSVFVFSAFALVIVMGHTPCSDIFAGSLLLTCLYLFFVYLKRKNKISLWFSTLACALAFGVKTTALIAFPSVFLLIIVIILLFDKKQLKTHILSFVLLLFVNFMIFSAYNYILNFIQYHNPISGTENFLLNKFRGGFLGYISNFIKYCFAIFDMSGINKIDFYNNFITKLLAKVLGVFGLSPDSYTSEFFDNAFEYNSYMSLDNSALGAMGLFAFLPALIISIIFGFKKNASPKHKLIAAFAFTLLFNILLFSRVMVFTRYNMRYLITFVCIASPVIVFSYIKSNKNLYKYILTLFLIVYLFVITISKPAAFLLRYNNFILHNPNIENSYDKFVNNVREENEVFKYFINKEKCKIGLAAFNEYPILFDIEKLKLYNFKMEKVLIENIESYNLTKYDYFITGSTSTRSSMVIKEKCQAANCVYFNYEGERTTLIDEAAEVECYIPISYILSQGFEIVKDTNLSEYIIFKNKRKSHTKI